MQPHTDEERNMPGQKSTLDQDGPQSGRKDRFDLKLQTGS
jgi:hypothetical protein